MGKGLYKIANVDHVKENIRITNRNNLRFFLVNLANFHVATRKTVFLKIFQRMIST